MPADASFPLYRDVDVVVVLTQGAPDDPALAAVRSMGAEKIAPLVAYLASDAAKDVTNQVFGVRRNEIFLYSKPRPVRSMAKCVLPVLVGPRTAVTPRDLA